MSKIKMPVEKSHIMMFARSIGDANPKYYEEKDENVIAPPTFIQSSAQFDPDYFLSVPSPTKFVSILPVIPIDNIP